MNQSQLQTDWLTSDGLPLWDHIKFTVICPRCEYDLRSLRRTSCPECGFAYDWSPMLAAAGESPAFLFDQLWSSRPLRSLFGTIIHSFRPSQFWRHVSIYKRFRRAPLMIMIVASILLFLITFPAGAWLVGEFIKLCVPVRKPVWNIYAKPPVFTFSEFMWYVSETFADTPSSFLRFRDNGMLGLITTIAAGSFMLTTTSAISLFGRLLSRSPIRFDDALRIMAYATPAACVISAVILLMSKFIDTYYQVYYDSLPPAASRILVLILVLLVIPGFYISSALHLYLECRRPVLLATVALICGSIGSAIAEVVVSSMLYFAGH